MPGPINESDAAAVITAVAELVEASLIDLDDVHSVLSVPKVANIVSVKPFLDEYRQAPERIVGTAELTTLDSFIAHVKRFGRSSSAVFAGRNQLEAVYDYHNSTKELGPEPAFCRHRATYAFPWSDEWKAWTAIDGLSRPQQAFAEFIEDHVADITAAADEDSKAHFGELGFKLASPAQMLAMSRGLAVRVETEAVARPNLSTGEIEVAYKEEHKDSAGQPLRVPGGFLLLIPAFEDGVLYRVPVRLRYRVQGGKVTWTTLMHRRAAVEKDAKKDACARVVDETQAPLFYGEPED